MRESERVLLSLLRRVSGGPLYFYEVSGASFKGMVEACVSEGYLRVEVCHFKELPIEGERQRCYVLSLKGMRELERLEGCLEEEIKSSPVKSAMTFVGNRLIKKVWDKFL